jgi:hypothetical protein
MGGHAFVGNRLSRICLLDLLGAAMVLVGNIKDRGRRSKQAIFDRVLTEQCLIRRRERGRRRPPHGSRSTSLGSHRDNRHQESNEEKRTFHLNSAIDGAMGDTIFLLTTDCQSQKTSSLLLAATELRQSWSCRSYEILTQLTPCFFGMNQVVRALSRALITVHSRCHGIDDVISSVRHKSAHKILWLAWW